jgi:tetratricopeptide (TPR) repeat protein
MAYRATGDRARATSLVQRRGSRPPALDDPLLSPSEVLLESAVTHEGLGMQALRNQRWDDAVGSFRKALALAPGDASLRYWLATALLMSGDAAGAEREFRTVVRAQPDYARAHFSLGVLHERRGELAGAQREFEETVRYAPNLPEGHLRLAETLRTAGNPAAAVPHYQAAITLDPGLADAWIGGAQALIGLGRGDTARDWLGRARRVHPDRRELADLAQRLAAR